MKRDRVLIQVGYVTWVPAAERMGRDGNMAIDVNAKKSVFTRLWAPIFLNDRGQHDPSLVKPNEQGTLWAQEEVIRMRPDGNEVLAVIEVKDLGLLESTIANQPKSDEGFNI